MDSPTSPDISLNDACVARICQLQQKENNPNLALRITISGGGCSGFQYDLKMDDRRQSDDLVFTRGGAAVVTDPVSLDLLRGSEIIFTSNLMGSYFEIKNPNANSSCGCGVSFSVG